MAAKADESEVRPKGRWRRIKRRWRASLVLAVALALTAFGTWTQRKPIARSFVDDHLASRGVPARYDITDLSIGRQRLTNLVIGDPEDPDLVADWVELGTAVGLSGATVDAVSAGQVRMRARLVDGKLSLGAIDKLMPPSSGKPFSLPRILANVEDLRLRIETPYGVVGAKIRGAGRLHDGFVGRLALVADQLDIEGCRLEAPRMALGLRVSGERPSVEGPVRLAALWCGGSGAKALAADLAVTLESALDRWTGRARVAASEAELAGGSASQLLGTITFAGNAAATGGKLQVKAGTLEIAHGAGNAAYVDGQYRLGRSGHQFAGNAEIGEGRLARRLLDAIAAMRDTGTGTPIGPIATRLSDAAQGLAGHFTMRAAIEAVSRDGASAIRVAQANFSSPSGARVDISGAPLRFGAMEFGGRIRSSGGGLPDALFTLQQGADGALSGRASIAPYTAGGARLGLTPVDFVSRAGGVTEIRTIATLSGPFGAGRVEDVRLPLEARLSGSRFALNPGCAPLSWSSVRVSGFALAPARLTLCPLGSALVNSGATMGGGARISSLDLRGSLGASPLAISASRADLRIASSDFALSGVMARIGAPGRATLIDATTLAGRIEGGKISGTFEGAGGRVGNVPLLLSKAAGRWSFANGALRLRGALAVSDAAEEARFYPLEGRNVAFTLADDLITAAGTLHRPGDTARIANVAIEHRLSSGAGHADLGVPGITFVTEGLQPEQLTPITYGVIAEVNGDVAGEGRIGWDANGVRSTGSFSTNGLNLAAAFGPVTGIKGRITFTDLLGLRTAPGQTATVASINPGIPVENGEVRYQLVGEQRVAVEGGRWPFSGGQLILEPTLLDFGQPAERRMTFRVISVDAAAFLQQFDFDNLNATGTFDGVLPMVFDASGGRIEAGKLAARSGGSIAYVGTVSEKDVGFWGNLAFQALKSLNYRNLDLTLNGPLAGEMVTEIRFAGVSQGEGTTSNFLIRRLAKLPFVFNVTVRAPFRQLADSVRSYYDPSRLITRNLPALLEEEKRRAAPPAQPPKPIQPSESETKP